MSDYQSAVYFKEYPCYHFPLHQHSQIRPIISLECNFEHSSRKIQINPPAAIIDKLSKKDTMYLLQWKKDEAGVNLYWRRFDKEKEWVLIKMNYYPDYIHICGGILFLLANQQMYIVIPSGDQTLLKPLVRDIIISVTPCLVAVASKNVVKYQPGVYALCFSQEQGYYAVEYSANATNIKKKGFLSNMSKMFNRFKTFNFTQKPKQFMYIEVLIPNILALAFLTPNEFCLFNLQTMELMPNLKAALIEGSLINQKPIIRFKSHSLLGTYQQTFMIIIGVGSAICSFYLMFKYNEKTINFDHFYREPLTNFNEGSFINWAEVRIRPYLVYIADGAILEDMQIMVRGLVYYARKNTADLIGKYRYLQMTSENGQCEHSIMNQECTIWKYYYQDQKEQNFLNKDRLLIPNRYPYELVKHLSQKYQDVSKIKEKIFNTWRNDYKFSSFLIYEDELLIVRKSSISVFRQINQSLYHWLNFTEQQILRIQTQTFVKNIFEAQNQRQLLQDQFQETNLCFNSIMPLIKQRMYFEPEDDAERKRIADVHRKFKNAFDSLEDILLIRHQYVTANVNISQLTRDLISGKLRDKLCYYNLALGSKVYFCNKDRERNSNKVFQKQNFVIKLIDYFYGLYHRSADYYDCFGHNLIDLFINKHRKQLSEDIDTAVSILLKKILQDLIPKEVSNNYESSMINPEINSQKIYSNPFVQFVISFIKECHEQDKIKQMLLLKWQLQRFLKLGFLDNKSIFFSQFYRNKSLIKALFISDSEQLIKSIFLRLLFLRNNIQTFLKLYKLQKKYISSNNRSFIEMQMFFSQNYSNHEFDLQLLMTNSYYLVNDDFNGQQNKEKLQKVIRTIFNSQLNSINLIKTDDFQPIQEMFDELTYDLENELEIINKIELSTTETEIYDPQQQLEFSQKVLTAFVDLFNLKVIQDSQLSYYNQIQAFPKQAQQFMNSRQVLSKILGCIKTSLQNYINRFQNFYGKTNYEGQSKITYQQRLMSQTFIQKPLCLIESNTGPILSEVLISLIFKALSCKDMDKDKEYHNPLTKFPNLIHFWKNSITQEEKQSKLYITYIDTNLQYRKNTSKQQQSKLYKNYFDEQCLRKPLS